MPVYEQLKNQPFVCVPFILDPLWIQHAVEGFHQFLNQPESIKNHIDFTIAPEHRRGDIGYKRRYLDERGFSDSKEFFHFHPALFDLYDEFLQQNPQILDFMYYASLIWDAVHATMFDFLSSMEPQSPGIVDKVFATQMPHIVLRFIRYDWQQSGTYLAKPHYDAGSCTLAIAQSSPGLRIGTRPDNLQLIIPKPQEAVFMWAANYRKLINEQGFVPGWHDVIQLDKTGIARRWDKIKYKNAFSRMKTC